MVKLKDCFKRCKTLKIGGFDRMVNNLKGAGRRGFFAFPITLSFIFFCTYAPTRTHGYHRWPTRTWWCKEGDVRAKPVRFQL